MPVVNGSQPPNNNKNSLDVFLNVPKQIKLFFANCMRKIKSIINPKKYIVSTSDADKSEAKDDISNNQYTPLVKAVRAKDVIPEHLKLVEKLNPKKIQNLRHFNKEEKQETDYVLGKGSFGEVNLAAQTNSNAKKNISPVLIKKQFITDIENSIYANAEAKTEHKQNKKFGVDSWRDKDNVVSKYKGESLDKLIQAPLEQQLPTKMKKNICHQLLEKLVEIHNKGGLHNDLKPGNILIDSKGKLSIIDFAGALQDSSRKKNYKSEYRPSMYSNLYAPPEMFIDDKKITQYYDCWSVGVIIYELYVGKSLMKDCYVRKEFHSNKIETTLQDKLNNNVKNNNNIPDDIKNLIYGLLKLEPTQRLTAEQALKSIAFDSKTFTLLTDIELTLIHDKHFNILVDLEDNLEKLTTNKFETKINELKYNINEEVNIIKLIQQEIQRRAGL